MTTIRFRPTFCLTSTLPIAEAEKQVRLAIDNCSNKVTGRFKDQHAMISIVEAKRHFWSPWLNLEFREGDEGCEILGRFSPHPGIWTAFMFSYLTLGVLTFFSIIIGVSQQLAGLAPTVYYFVPLWCLIAITLWTASLAGQKLAVEEMGMMKLTVQQCVFE